MINLIVNGNSYSYPQPGDKANTGWGSQATNWASAVTAALTALGLGGTLTPTPNAVIDISSTTKGILVPRLTTTQRNAIISPATSLLIFNTTLGVFQYYSGSAWITIGAKIPDNVQFDGTLTVNGNISTNGGVTAVGAVTGASLNTTGLATAATGNFTDATDATNSDTAPLKTAGGMAVKKKLFVGSELAVGNGTAANPSISFSNDLDNGLYYISANVFGLSAGGTKIAQFDSNGITANLPYWNIVDQKANGTAGGTFSNTLWRTRDLNTTRGTNSISGSSLASNQFTLSAGTYKIYAAAPAYYVGNHKAKLRNITDSSDVIIGTNERSGTSGIIDSSATRSFILGIFTIASQKTFEIQHQCTSTQNNDGFGNPSSFSVSEIYTVVELWKLA